MYLATWKRAVPGGISVSTRDSREIHIDDSDALHTRTNVCLSVSLSLCVLDVNAGDAQWIEWSPSGRHGALACPPPVAQLIDSQPSIFIFIEPTPIERRTNASSWHGIRHIWRCPE